MITPSLDLVPYFQRPERHSRLWAPRNRRKGILSSGQSCEKRVGLRHNLSPDLSHLSPSRDPQQTTAALNRPVRQHKARGRVTGRLEGTRPGWYRTLPSEVPRVHGAGRRGSLQHLEDGEV
ncbi:hypothetical protein NDU88_010025 [Pleurodeles waltl]|uniref:Uncharacterized protein n=1 Tax=Pleurodeles waltl TaxID=8319 RepID=A0AAV7PTQ7_PLEWA|nr:hypothetical protein NDU88_010025 [Pleurodeles waltl]